MRLNTCHALVTSFTLLPMDAERVEQLTVGPAKTTAVTMAPAAGWLRVEGKMLSRWEEDAECPLTPPGGMRNA